MGHGGQAPGLVERIDRTQLGDLGDRQRALLDVVDAPGCGVGEPLGQRIRVNLAARALDQRQLRATGEEFGRARLVLLHMADRMGVDGRPGRAEAG